MWLFLLGLWLGGAVCRFVMVFDDLGLFFWIAPVDAALWPLTMWLGR